MSDVKSYLSSIILGDVGLKPIVHVDSSASFASGLYEMGVAGSLSVPVFDPQSDTWHNVDVLDILATLNTLVEPASWFDDNSLSTVLFAPEAERASFQPGALWEKLAAKTFKDLINISKRNPFPILDSKLSVWDAVVAMNEQKAHRIGITTLGKENAPVLAGMLTQSDVISFLTKSKRKLNHGVQLKLSSKAEFDAHDPVMVNAKDSAISAFMVMYEQHVSGVGVVDDHGRLVGALSAHDLKALYFGREAFLQDLLKPVGSFSEALVSSNPMVNSPPKLCVVQGKRVKMDELVELFYQNHVHRLFCVQEEKLVGVVSQTDVLSRLNE